MDHRQSPIQPFLDAMAGDWQRSLESDEFYLHDIERLVTVALSPTDAFTAIDDLVRLILATSDEASYFWCASLLAQLVRISNTTERPTVLKQNWGEVLRRIGIRGDVTPQIAEWYRQPMPRSA